MQGARPKSVSKVNWRAFWRLLTLLRELDQVRPGVKKDIGLKSAEYFGIAWQAYMTRYIDPGNVEGRAPGKGGKT